MGSIPVKYSFDVTQEGDVYTFSYRYSKPSLIARILNTALFLLIVFALSSLGTIFAILAWGGFAFAMYHFHFSPQHHFKISPSHFILGNREYAREHISTLYVKAPKGLQGGQSETRSSVFIVGSGVMGGMMTGVSMATGALNSAAGSLGRANAQEGAKVRFKICFRFGEKEIVLARRLNEHAACALYDKVMEVVKE